VLTSHGNQIVYIIIAIMADVMIKYKYMRALVCVCVCDCRVVCCSTSKRPTTITNSPPETALRVEY